MAEDPRQAEQREEVLRALDALKDLNRQLRAQNDLSAGRRPRPELRVIQGGRGA